MSGYCESCANGTDGYGRCAACGRDIPDPYAMPSYSFPEPGWCMTPEEEFASRVERGLTLPSDLLGKLLS